MTVAQPGVQSSTTAPAVVVRRLSSSALSADVLAAPGKYVPVSFTTTPGAKCTFPQTPSGGAPLSIFADSEGVATFGVTPSDASRASDTLQFSCTAGGVAVASVSLTVRKAPGHAQPVANGPVPAIATSTSQIAAANAALGIDLATASEKDLIDLGLPPRPDPNAAQDGYVRWLHAVVSPTTKVYKKTVSVDETHKHLDTPLSKQSIRAAKDFTPEGSGNYASLIAVGNPGTWGTISAEWYVPTVINPSGSNQFSSLWVGMDGTASYTQGLMQNGTTSAFFLYNGTLISTYYMWYEQLPTQATSQLFFAISPGDDAYCQTYYRAPYAYYWCKDVTTGQVGSTALAYSSYYNGADADWVVERLQSPGGSLYPLADFQSAYMRGAWVASASTGNWINFDSQWGTGLQLTMYGSTTLATAQADASPGVTFTWQGSQ